MGSLHLLGIESTLENTYHNSYGYITKPGKNYTNKFSKSRMDRSMHQPLLHLILCLNVREKLVYETISSKEQTSYDLSLAIHQTHLCTTRRSNQCWDKGGRLRVNNYWSLKPAWNCKKFLARVRSISLLNNSYNPLYLEQFMPPSPPRQGCLVLPKDLQGWWLYSEAKLNFLAARASSFRTHCNSRIFRVSYTES